METKFKVGDKVLLNKPKYKYNNAIIWQKEMERYVGDIFEVVSVNADSKLYYCDGKYINNWFHESWLTKIEEQVTEQVIEQVTEQVTEQEPQQCCEKRGIEPVDLTKKQVDLIKKEDLSNIDWEQRRWDLASKLFSLTSHEQAISSADSFIEHYKQKLS